MNNPFAPDIEAMRGACGVSLAVGSGVCKAPDCKRRAPHLVDGYCAACVARHGVQWLRLTPEAAEDAPQTETGTKS